MMRSLRASLGVLALWCALGASVSAKTRTEPPAPAAPDCDMMCEFGAYLSRDHMIVAVPSADPAPLPGAAAHPARKAAKPVVPKVVVAAHPVQTRPTVGSAAGRVIAGRAATPRRTETAVRTDAPVPRKRPPVRTLALSVPGRDPPEPAVVPRPRPRREIAIFGQSAVPAAIPGSAPLMATQFEATVTR